MPNEDIIRIGFKAEDIGLFEKQLNKEFENTGTQLGEKLGEAVFERFQEVFKQSNKLGAFFTSITKDSLKGLSSLEEVNEVFNELIEKVNFFNNIQAKNGGKDLFAGFTEGDFKKILGYYDDILKAQASINRLTSRENRNETKNKFSFSDFSKVEENYKVSTKVQKAYNEEITEYLKSLGVETSAIEGQIYEYSKLLAILDKVSNVKAKVGSEDYIKKQSALGLITNQIQSFEKGNDILSQFRANIGLELSGVYDIDRAVEEYIKVEANRLKQEEKLLRAAANKFAKSKSEKRKTKFLATLNNNPDVATPDITGIANQLKNEATEVNQSTDQIETDIQKYIVSLEEAEAKIKELKISKGGDLSKSITPSTIDAYKELLGYMQRYADLGGDINKLGVSGTALKAFEGKFLGQYKNDVLAMKDAISSFKDVSQSDNITKDGIAGVSSDVVDTLKQRIDALETTVTELKTNFNSLDNTEVFKNIFIEVNTLKTDMQQLAESVKEVGDSIGFLDEFGQRLENITSTVDELKSKTNSTPIKTDISSGKVSGEKTAEQLYEESNALAKKAGNLKQLTEQYRLLRNINNDITVRENPDNYINSGNGAKSFNGFDKTKTGSGLEDLRKYKQEILDLNPQLNSVADSTDRISKAKFTEMFGSSFENAAKSASVLADKEKQVISAEDELNYAVSSLPPDFFTKPQIRADALNVESQQAKIAYEAESKLNEAMRQVNETPVSTPTLFQDSNGQLSFIENLATAEDKLEQQVRETTDALQSQNSTAIPGQISMEEYLANQAKAEDQLEQQVKETTFAITDQQAAQQPNQSSTQIEAEISQLESLREKVSEVTTAFDQKSNAITNEKIVMEIAAKSEVKFLQSVHDKVNELKSDLSGLVEKPIEVNVNNTKSGSNDSSGKSKSSSKSKTSDQDKLTEKEVQQIADKREQAESKRQKREQQQREAQAKAINKAQEERYKQQVKDDEAALKAHLRMLEEETKAEQAEYDSRRKARKAWLKQAQDESRKRSEQEEKLAKSSKNIVDKIYNQNSKQYEKLSADKNISKYPEQYVIVLAQIDEKLKEIQSIGQMDIVSNTEVEQAKKLDEEIKELFADLNNSDKLANRAKASSLSANMSQYLSMNTRLKGTSYETEIRLLIEQLKNVDQLSNVQLQNIVDRFGQLKTEINEARKAGKSFVNIFNDKRLYGFAAQLANMFSFYRVIGYIRSAIDTIRELDTALVDLKKTTSMTSNELNQFYYDSNKIAKQMGVTTKEIIEQASAWSRLGFNTKETSTQMAQLSSKFASISPGMDTDQSQSGLVSIMKAWNISTENAEREIMDNINTLGNKFALTNLDIVEGMQRSAAAMAAIGEDWRSSFAIFTGGQEIVQNAEKMGTAMRSFSLRIRGYSEDSEDDALELDEDLKTITGDLVDLTKTAEHTEGISIFKEGSTTEFKSLVEYLGEVSDIWDEMTQVQQTQFLQKAFAKTQAQAGAAIIQNFDQVRKALEEMENAAGSSDREMSIIQESIDYKLNSLSQTWVGTFQKLIDRGDIGKLIDLLTKLSEAIGSVMGVLGFGGTLGVGVGAYAGIKKFGTPNSHIGVKFNQSYLNSRMSHIILMVTYVFDVTEWRYTTI